MLDRMLCDLIGTWMTLLHVFLLLMFNHNVLLMFNYGILQHNRQYNPRRCLWKVENSTTCSLDVDV